MCRISFLLSISLLTQVSGFHSNKKPSVLGLIKHSRTLSDKEQQQRNTVIFTSDEISHSYPKRDDFDRRGFVQSVVATVSSSFALANAPIVSNAATLGDVFPDGISTNKQYWPLGKLAFSLLPLAGTYTSRSTVEECILEDTIWTHDQVQGVVNVNVPVRQTVIKLSPAAGGGLLVHNPVAPTPQLIDFMKELEKAHGPVRHIVLGTVALEHKATAGPFAQYFPKATLWIQPGQWSFPVDVPIAFLGVNQRGAKLREIPPPGAPDQPEWTADLDYEVLGPLRFKSVGAFSETAFFHRDSKTLLVTDTVVSVTEDPPEIIKQGGGKALLFHARDKIDDGRGIITQDAESQEDAFRRGWRRMVQFGLVFFPSQIDVVPFTDAISQANAIRDRKVRSLGEGAVPFSLYPWTWHEKDADKANFAAISQNGALFCPPILTKLILDREPERTLEWVDRVCNRFSFERVVACHLNNNVKANPKQFYAAFDPLRSRPNSLKPQRALSEDLALLQKASDLLTRFGVVGPSDVCDGEPARTEGRFKSKTS